MLQRRYRVVALIECPTPGCGGIIVTCKQVGGTAEDPLPLTAQPFSEPDINLEDHILADDPGEEFAQSIMKSMKRMGFKITPFGSAPPPVPDINDWRFELRPEEYATIGPLTIGSILMQSIEPQKVETL